MSKSAAAYTTADEFRAAAHEAVELMAEALARETEAPVITSASGAEVRAAFDEPLPRAGCDAAELLRRYRERLLAFNRRNGHPRFFGFVCGSADPIGALADGLTSMLNQNVTSWRSAPGATEIERLVVRWIDEMLGFGGGGLGVLVSGGSAANLTAMTCAVADAERRWSSAPGARERLTCYTSTEGHLSLRKAARHLGVAPANIRSVAVDGQRRMSPEDLDRQLTADRHAGLFPACVAASAGTVNTGAIDPLGEIADVCRQHAVWFHVDGAYGALAALTDDHAWLRHGFARADSLAVDPHKWLFAPMDVGCVLVRDDAAWRRAFGASAEYTAVTQTDPIERFAFWDYSLELSRRSRGLKVWLILKVRGVDQIAAKIAENITIRQYLDARIATEPRLELLGSGLSVSCFRYVPEAETDPRAIDALNRQILEALVAQGEVYMSPTTLDGNYALRICIVNFRTQLDDIDFLFDEIVRLGSRFAAATAAP